jgi:hypothetical protein
VVVPDDEEPAELAARFDDAALSVRFDDVAPDEPSDPPPEQAAVTTAAPAAPMRARARRRSTTVDQVVGRSVMYPSLVHSNCEVPEHHRRSRP